jgi:hypothetical protein
MLNPSPGITSGLGNVGNCSQDACWALSAYVPELCGDSASAPLYNHAQWGFLPAQSWGRMRS